MTQLPSLLVHDEYMHVRAKANFEHFLASNTLLLTSSYVLLETLTLLQRHVSLKAVWDFHHKIMPLLNVVWADGGWHSRPLQRLQAERNRSVNLTDCLSLENMEALEITTAFTFDGRRCTSYERLANILFPLN